MLSLARPTQRRALQRQPSLAPWDQWFDDFWGNWNDLFQGPTGLEGDFDLYEDGDALHLEVDLPGVKAENVNLTLENNHLQIEAERPEPPQDEGQRQYVRRRSWGKTRRVFTLPVEVEADKIDARFSDGVLRIRLPKAATSRARRIEVKK